MNDPHVISILATIFSLLGVYNLFLGSRRIREARLAGQPMRWYKQSALLTGIEYILLAFVFLLSLASQQGNIAPGMRGLVAPLYFLLLILAAIIAGLVIRQGILNSRAQRAARRARVASAARTPSVVTDEYTLSKRVQEEQAQRQRERRKKAATARRRRAGKA